jgi:hypothetical protein
MSRNSFTLILLQKMGKTKVHIGELIVLQLERKERSITWLAQKLDKDPSNFCKQIKNNFMDIHLLLKISELLDCDFFADLSILYQKQKTKQQ